MYASIISEFRVQRTCLTQLYVWRQSRLFQRCNWTVCTLCTHAHTHTRSLTYTVELEGVQEHMQPEHVQAQMNAIASNANDIAKETRRLHLSHERRNSTLVIKMWPCISYFLPYMGARWTNRISKLRLFQTLLKSVENYFALSPPPSLLLYVCIHIDR